MKKNFYAVALAMLTACTTFVGCKDYDSDIKNLQTQIDANKSAIEALQQAIAKGVTISGIEKKSDGYTIKFSDGSTVDLANGKDGVDGTDGKDAPVPQLRVNAAKNWEMSADGGATWAELKDAAGNSIADAKAYVDDYVKIDESGYLVIGDKTTSFKYDVTIPSVTEDVENKVAIITVPATATEAMKTLRVPMEGYFDRLFVSNITPVKGHATLEFTKTTISENNGVRLGRKYYAKGDVIYTTVGMPVVINPAQVNAGVMTFTFVANTGTAEPETMPVTLALTPGSDAAISVTKSAPATGLWTVSGTVTDGDFAGFDNVALCALNGNGTNTLSDYAFEIDVQAGAASAGSVASTVSQNDGSAAVIAAAADIIDSYAAFDDGSQEKDGYIVRRADQSVPADAPYTGDWEVVPAPAPAMMAMLTKAATPTTELRVVYTAVGLDGAKAETNVAVSFFAPIPAPEVFEYAVSGIHMQDGDGSTATGFTVNLGDLESKLFSTVPLQTLWENNAKNLEVKFVGELVKDGTSTVKFYNDGSDLGTKVNAVSDFNKIEFSIKNPTAAIVGAAIFSYTSQADGEEPTEVKINFFLTSPVATVTGPADKQIANTPGESETVTVAVADFKAEDGEEIANTVSGGIVSIKSASSMEPEKMKVELSGGDIVCTRVPATAPAEDEEVTVNALVADKWGLTFNVAFNVTIAAEDPE